MIRTIRCTDCGFENSATGRFCSKCGRAITAQCKVCGEDVQLDSRFCGNCGVEIVAATAGLTVANALAWRQQFQNIGWWETPDERCLQLIGHLTEQGQLPTTDSPFEPWILVCNGSFAPWKPHFSVEVKRGFALDSDMCMLATRCRLFFFALKQASSARTALRKMFTEIPPRVTNVSTALWYADIADVSRHQDNNAYRFCIRTKTEEVAISIKVEGIRLIDLVAAFAASDVVARNWARYGIQVRTGRRLEFVELISAFLREVSEVHGTNMQ